MVPRSFKESMVSATSFLFCWSFHLEVSLLPQLNIACYVQTCNFKWVISKFTSVPRKIYHWCKILIKNTYTQNDHIPIARFQCEARPLVAILVEGALDFSKNIFHIWNILTIGQKRAVVFT